MELTRNQGLRGALPRLLWPLPAIASCVVGLTFWQTGRWSVLGVPLGERHFGDLRIVTTTAECAAADPSWNINSFPCAPEAAIYNYPSIWAQILGRLNVDRTHTDLIAAALIIIFAITLGYLTRVVCQRGAGWLALLVMSACGLSPAVLLAFERGNIDVLVYAVLVLGLALSTRRKARAAGAFLGLATGLKLFPIGAVCALFIDRPVRKAAVLLFVAVGGVGLALAARDFSLISSRTPLLDGAAFGAAELPLLVANQMSLGANANVIRAVGLLGFVAVLALILLASRLAPRNHFSAALSQLTVSLQSDRIASILVLGGGGAFVVAYLAGPSFDYRLIFLIPCVAGLLILQTRAANTAALLLTLQLILSYSTFVGSAQYLSDLMLLILVPGLTVILWRVSKSGSRDAVAVV